MKRTSKRTRPLVILIGMFTVYAALLICGGWYASGIAPNLMARNYRSIQFSSAMESSLTSIFIDAANGKEAAPADVERFEKNLAAAKENITEKGEPEILAQISARWKLFRSGPLTPAPELFQNVAASLNDLTEVNERSMESFQETASSLRYTFILGGAMGLFLFLLYSLQLVLGTSLEDTE